MLFESREQRAESRERLTTHGYPEKQKLLFLGLYPKGKKLDTGPAPASNKCPWYSIRQLYLVSLQAFKPSRMDIAIERVRAWTSGPLDLTSLGLKELPELPAGLTWLYCSYNQLTTLPDTLPSGLTTLYCYGNQLTTLPDPLPAGLTMLYCGDNQLTTLPDTLPAGITYLDCSRNQLTTLPDTLPAGLTVLLCGDNQLTILPDTLPAGLIGLYCSDNQLTTLPDTLPAGLTILQCYNNHFPDMEDDETIPDYVARICVRRGSQ
jgi:hypothetical protein